MSKEREGIRVFYEDLEELRRNKRYYDDDIADDYEDALDACIRTLEKRFGFTPDTDTTP